MTPSGFIIEVPVTLSVAVRGTTIAESKRLAQDFVASLNPSKMYCTGFTETAQREGIISKAVSVTEATLESIQKESCKVREELVADYND